jgi:hypothetical protein
MSEAKIQASAVCGRNISANQLRNAMEVWPCNSRRRDSQDCFMDHGGDDRRKLFCKHMIVVLEQDRALLIRLIQSIRHSDRKDLTETIGIFRGGASLAAIRPHLPENRCLRLVCESQVTRDETTAVKRHDPETKSYRYYLDISKACVCPD